MLVLLSGLFSASKPMILKKRGSPFKPKFLQTCIAFITALLFSATTHVIAQNSVVTENEKPGNPASEWDISGAGDLTIQGFGTDISVNKGDTIRFKIRTDASSYSINIYRLGYYQGNGARKVGTGTVTATLPQIQPNDLYDSETGLTDCRNWLESARWAVPSTAVSGVYIAKLTRANNGGSSHIIFVVRDDQGSSDLLFKTADATWQAYNVYGGNSLYIKGNLPPLAYHAQKVSYNRPLITRAGGGGGDPGKNSLFNAEYPMIRWLERNGYDVDYTTCVDMNRSNLPITPINHKILMSVGHDEYWSAADKNKFEEARNAGVHLAFFSGNEIYWKVRYEDNFRTLVCYKEGAKVGAEIESLCGSKCDPLSSVWTGLWDQGCEFPLTDGCKIANGLTGTGHMNVKVSTGPITVPDTHKELRFWRNTSVEDLNDSDVATLSNGTLGYEWDYYQPSQNNPPGQVLLSTTTVGALTHHLSLYKHKSGALVFGAGTVQWSWGLDDKHEDGTSVQDIRIQQATVNLFADMNVQPGTRQNNLVAAIASADDTPPLSTISSPVSGFSVTNESVVTVTGTAADDDGVVAGVEVSVDGGLTWQLATGTSDWSYSWTPKAEGQLTIISRSFDDLGNIEETGNTPANNLLVLNVAPRVCPCTIFRAEDRPEFPLSNDNTPIELGFKFRTTQNGFITGIRFYKGEGQTGSHSGHLWTTSGLLLSAVNFVNETESGWQDAVFTSPVAVTAGITYIASTFSTSGDYAKTNPFFTKSYGVPPIIALADGEDGPNGVGLYSPAPAFPSSYYETSNYWVDVVFNTTGVIITKQPVSTFVCAGSTAVFTSGASNAAVTTVKWQVSLNGILWTDIPGATSDTLKINTTVAEITKQYRAVWTNSTGSTNSLPATLTIGKVLATYVATSIGCSSGTIIVTPTTGIAPFSYSLNGGAPQTGNTFGGLIGGTYSITVKDAKGCTLLLPSIAINSPISTLSVALGSKINVNCSGSNGSITVVATGGTSPYQYSLNGVNFQTTATFANLSAGTYSVLVKDSKGCSVTLSGVVISQASTLAAALLARGDETCAGDDGFIKVTATGGTSPYTYSLNGVNYQTSNTFSKLSDGTYTIRVKDASGCVTSTTAITLVQINTLRSTLTARTDANCNVNDGTLTITATGGTAPYYYVLNTGTYQTTNVFRYLAPGVYTVYVIDSKRCISTVANIRISSASNLSVAVTAKTNESCSGRDGTITVSGAGGRSPYTYSIDGGYYQTGNTFYYVGAGTHRITVRDYSGCTSTLSDIVVAMVPFKAYVSSKTGVSCAGKDGSISITATGGKAPFQYSINGGSYFYDSDNKLTNLLPGTYAVKVKDAKGCTYTVTGIVVATLPKLTAVVASKTNACSNRNNGTIIIAASGGTAPYQYSLNWGSYRTSGAFSSLCPGTYFVIVKDAKGCITNVSWITISRTTTPCATLFSRSATTDAKSKDATISENDVVLSVQVSPNPTSGIFNVELNGLNNVKAAIQVVDVTGKRVAFREVIVTAGRYIEPFNLLNEARGVYFVNVTTAKGVITKKVIIQ